MDYYEVRLNGFVNTAVRIEYHGVVYLQRAADRQLASRIVEERHKL